ncbi:MAG: molybdopterin-dependent oxidoreductase, partial [Bacillota bacterium]
ILLDEDTVGREAVKLFASAAVLAGKVGAAYRGIVLARSKNNTQGAIDMGFVLSADSVIKDINGGKIKALVVIGENPAISPENVKLLNNLSFLAVYDIFMTETAAAADVVLPLVSSAETAGTYTRSDRRIQAVNAALRPRTGKDNLQVLLDTAG